MTQWKILKDTQFKSPLRTYSMFEEHIYNSHFFVYKKIGNANKIVCTAVSGTKLSLNIS